MEGVTSAWPPLFDGEVDCDKMRAPSGGEGTAPSHPKKRVTGPTVALPFPFMEDYDARDENDDIDSEARRPLVLREPGQRQREQPAPEVVGQADTQPGHQGGQGGDCRSDGAGKPAKQRRVIGTDES